MLAVAAKGLLANRDVGGTFLDCLVLLCVEDAAGDFGGKAAASAAASFGSCSETAKLKNEVRVLPFGKANQ